MVPIIRGLYATRRRVIPNVDGVFAVTMLNVSTSDICLKSRKVMGNIQPTSEIMATTDQHIDEKLAIDTIKIANHLSANEVSKITALIIDYQDIFASNPKQTKKNRINRASNYYE